MSAATRLYRVMIGDRILAERDRQEGFILSGRFKETCANPEMNEGAKWAVLMEEIGEVAEAQLNGERDEMLTEMVQVAAVAAAWAESLLIEQQAILTLSQATSSLPESDSSSGRGSKGRPG